MPNFKNQKNPTNGGSQNEFDTLINAVCGSSKTRNP